MGTADSACCRRLVQHWSVPICTRRYCWSDSFLNTGEGTKDQSLFGVSLLARLLSHRVSHLLFVSYANSCNNTSSSIRIYIMLCSRERSGRVQLIEAQPSEMYLVHIHVLLTTGYLRYFHGRIMFVCLSFSQAGRSALGYDIRGR